MAKPTPEKIIAALEAACKKYKVPWPIRYPTPHNITPRAQDYAFIMEIRSVLATSSLGWDGLLLFIGKATGKIPKRTDWSATFREATALVHMALGITEQDLDGPLPDRVKVLSRWGIRPDQLAQEQSMAKSKQTKGKKETTPAPAKGKASTKSLAPVAPPPLNINPDSLGGLEVCAAFLASISDYVVAVATETGNNQRVKELADLLTKAVMMLDKLTE